jgi:hypothetical protein
MAGVLHVLTPKYLFFFSHKLICKKYKWVWKASHLQFTLLWPNIAKLVCSDSLHCKQSKFNKHSNMINEMLLISLANSENKFPVSFSSPLQNRRFTHYCCLHWIFLRKAIHNWRQFLLPWQEYYTICLTLSCIGLDTNLLQTHTHNPDITLHCSYKWWVLKNWLYSEGWTLIPVEICVEFSAQIQTLAYTRVKNFGDVCGSESTILCPSLSRNANRIWWANHS